MKEEADVNLYPPWLYKYRSYDLWYIDNLKNILMRWGGSNIHNMITLFFKKIG